MKHYRLPIGVWPLLAAALFFTGCTGEPLRVSCASQDPSSIVSEEPLKKLIGYLEDVKNADGFRLAVKDNRGQTMDGAKIIPHPYMAHHFLAVYHTYDPQGTACVHLADSTDLLTWQFVVSLAGEAGQNATQPTLYAMDDGFMAAWEQEPNNHIRLAYYADWEALKAAQPSRTFDCPQMLSPYAEGTPCIYSATKDSAVIGFHYYKDKKADRQAQGRMTGWKEWGSNPQPQIDQALLDYGIQGNIGDRDLFTFDGKDYLFIEGGGDNQNFGNWRCFLYDPQTETAVKLHIQTPGGSLAFANPTATPIILNGRPALVCSVFIPTENSAPGEPGCCIYYHYTD